MSPHPKSPYYQRISYRLLKRLRSTVRVQVGEARLAVPMNETGTLTSLWWAPSWKTTLIGSLLGNQSDGVFIDIGANVGQTLFDFVASGSRARYLGFEPNPRCVTYVDHLIRLNGLRNASVVPVALGSRPGIVKLLHSPDQQSDSGAFIEASIRPAQATGHDFVSCHVFDDVAQDLDSGRILLCKIDVEGYETEVLVGMRRTLAEQRPPVLCEVLDADAHADLAAHDARLGRLEGLLHELGYRIHRIVKSPAGKFDRLEPIDAFPRRRYDESDKDAYDYLFCID